MKNKLAFIIIAISIVAFIIWGLNKMSPSKEEYYTIQLLPGDSCHVWKNSTLIQTISIKNLDSLLKTQ